MEVKNEYYGIIEEISVAEKPMHAYLFRICFIVSIIIEEHSLADDNKAEWWLNKELLIMMNLIFPQSKVNAPMQT